MSQNHGKASGGNFSSSSWFFDHPLRNLLEWWKARDVFEQPWKALALRHSKGEVRPVTVNLKDGSAVHFRSGTMDKHILWSIFLHDGYRIDQIAEKKLGVVVDVGAQIGCFSLKMAPRCERLLSFEPVPANFELLQKNLKQYSHAELFPCALLNRKEKLKIYLSHSNTGGHSAFDTSSHFIETESLRLPELLVQRGIEKIDFLKIDCEGSEYEVIESLRNWGLKRIQRFALEYQPIPNDPDPNKSGDALEKLLHNEGFTVERIAHDKQKGLGLLFAYQRRW